MFYKHRLVFKLFFLKACPNRVVSFKAPCWTVCRNCNKISVTRIISRQRKHLRCVARFKSIPFPHGLRGVVETRTTLLTKSDWETDERNIFGVLPCFNVLIILYQSLMTNPNHGLAHLDTITALIASCFHHFCFSEIKHTYLIRLFNLWLMNYRHKLQWSKEKMPLGSFSDPRKYLDQFAAQTDQSFFSPTTGILSVCLAQQCLL